MLPTADVEVNKYEVAPVFDFYSLEVEDGEADVKGNAGGVLFSYGITDMLNIAGVLTYRSAEFENGGEAEYKRALGFGGMIKANLY